MPNVFLTVGARTPVLGVMWCQLAGGLMCHALRRVMCSCACMLYCGAGLISLPLASAPALWQAERLVFSVGWAVLCRR